MAGSLRTLAVFGTSILLQIALGFWSPTASAQHVLEFHVQNVQTAGGALEFDVAVRSNTADTRLGAVQLYVAYNTAKFGPSVKLNNKIQTTKGTLIGGAGYANGSADLAVATPLAVDNQVQIVAVSIDYGGTCDAAAIVPGPGVAPAQLVHVRMEYAVTAGINDIEFLAGPVQPSMVGQQFKCDNLQQYQVAVVPYNVLFADVRAFLQGGYSGGTMTTALKTAALIPLTQPFAGTPWSYAGTETVAAIPAGVVDWALVELRSGDPTSPPMTVASRRAGFFHLDGKIVDLDGASALEFTGIAPGSYYVLVYHRNHMPVMSATPADFSGGSATFDFRDAMTKAYGSNAMATLAGGKFGLYAGDANNVSGITASDNAVWVGQNGTDGYKLGDFNINGQITAADAALWTANNGKGLQVPAAN